MAATGLKHGDTGQVGAHLLNGCAGMCATKLTMTQGTHSMERILLTLDNGLCIPIVKQGDGYCIDPGFISVHLQTVPKLNSPAKVGTAVFGAGVRWSIIIGAAQRAYQDRDEPAPTAEQIAAFYLAFPHMAPARTTIEDVVLVPRGLLGAACAAIDKQRDAPKTLAQLQRYTTGDLSHTTPTAQDTANVTEAEAVAALTVYDETSFASNGCPANGLDRMQAALESFVHGNAAQQEPVGEVCDMKYGHVRFYKLQSYKYLQPGAKLYTEPQPAQPSVQELQRKLAEAENRIETDSKLISASVPVEKLKNLLYIWSVNWNGRGIFSELEKLIAEYDNKDGA